MNISKSPDQESNTTYTENDQQADKVSLLLMLHSVSIQEILALLIDARRRLKMSFCNSLSGKELPYHSFSPIQSMNLLHVPLNVIGASKFLRTSALRTQERQQGLVLQVKQQMAFELLADNVANWALVRTRILVAKEAII